MTTSRTTPLHQRDAAAEMDNTSLPVIADALRAHQRFVIMSHYRPDGDALGCELSLALSLKEMGKDVTVWNQDGCLEKLRFLPGSELVQKPPTAPEDFDVAIALDTAVQDRVGTCLPAVGKVKLWINIDHHISNNGYGDMAYIDPTAPAAGQILFELITQCELPMNAGIAENLFTAISTDTGSFQYSNTTARTLEIAAQLVKVGVNVGRISEQLYQTYPLRRLELLRSLLNSLRITSEGRAASFSLSLETAERLGVTPEDNEGLIDHIRAIEGVRVAVFFEEMPENKVRVSMRSKDPRYDVCAICAQFGGGGHTQAAGARLTGPLATAEERVLAAISASIAAAPNN
jgi:phosphoesterase RecJ-like protein